MLLLDVIIRYPTVCLLFLAVLLIVRDAWHIKQARYAALMALSVGAMVIATPYPGLELPYYPAHAAFRFIDAANIVFIWWFGRSLFEDDFRLGWMEWLGFVLVGAPTLSYRLYELGITDVSQMLSPIVGSSLSALLIAHLIYVTISGRQDDVIESRRRMRFYFVLGLCIATLLIIASERLYSETNPVEISILRTAIIFPMALWGVLWLTRLEGEKLAFAPVQQLVIAEPAVDPRDSALHQQLLEEMEHRHAFRESGLSIRHLAERLKVPEHRLRALINKGMGYRNFSSFVNDYRIAAIKEAMQQADNARTPILTLALNEGFNSLAPFNRAFRASTGQTPTEYRDSLSNKPDQN